LLKEGELNLQKWIRKSFVVLVSILTFGLITPPLDFLNENVSAKSSAESDGIESLLTMGTTDRAPLSFPDKLSEKEKFIEGMMKKAEIQSFQKFGTKIKPVIEDEFRDVVLPNIEKALEEVAGQFPEEDLVHLTISEQPGAGLSEKIFHIKNQLTSEEIIRFHVRRDNPPKAGHWFNFHYHTYHDQFHDHYQLGSIYWDKNMPPKWMS
jgi:hypothetical protein